jgi:hypothetical protein
MIWLHVATSYSGKLRQQQARSTRGLAATARTQTSHIQHANALLSTARPNPTHDFVRGWVKFNLTCSYRPPMVEGSVESNLGLVLIRLRVAFVWGFLTIQSHLFVYITPVNSQLRTFCVCVCGCALALVCVIANLGKIFTYSTLARWG